MKQKEKFTANGKHEKDAYPKVLAMYLPQFHEIPENNEWWGQGFTEWTNVRKALPLYKGHLQPRVPFGENYYNLSDHTVMLKQMDMARRYGVDGFCFYHYWFHGKKLLEKPLERLLHEKKQLLSYCFCWANEPWTRTWDGKGEEKKVIMPQEYGGKKDWKEHFEYLNMFFRQEEYIKVSGKPVIVLYKPGEITNLKEMLTYWEMLAKEEGYPGLFILNMLRLPGTQEDSLIGDGAIDFEPFATLARNGGVAALERISDFYPGSREDNRGKKYQVIDFDRFCKIMSDRYTLKHTNHYLGLFTGWDNTPRRGIDTGIIFENNTPEIFEKYFEIQYKRSIELGNLFLFINAWNEWGEGTCLEPDQKYGYQYLEAIYKIKHKY